MKISIKVLVSGAVFICAGAVLGQSAFEIQVDAAKGEALMTYKARKLMVYAFAPSQFKPYVRELHSLRGQNVLRDAPADHLHHHGLMYAIRVNGTNFWEERELSGVQKSFSFKPRQNGLAQRIHWLPGQQRNIADSAAAALLIEDRTLQLAVDEKKGEVALRWTSRFRVGKNAVELHGSNYNGLGLRPPQTFDRAAQLGNSLDQPYGSGPTQDVIPAAWTIMSGRVDDREVSVAMFGHPSNAPGKTWFFTMREPFSYMAATQGLDRQPLQYAPRQRFELKYLVSVFDGNPGRAALEERSRAWEKTSK